MIASQEHINVILCEVVFVHSIDHIVCVYVEMGMWFACIVYACARVCSKGIIFACELVCGSGCVCVPADPGDRTVSILLAVIPGALMLALRRIGTGLIT